MSWESQLIALLSASLLRPFALAVAAWLVLRIFRVRHPASKHAVWTAVLVAMVLLPILTVIAPHWNVPVLPARREASAPPAVVTPASFAAAEVVPQIATGSPAEPAAPSSKPVSSSTLLVWSYLAGVLAMLLYRAAGWMMLRRVVARSTQVRGTALRESRDVVTPVAVGVLRPAVLLPIGWRNWSPATRRAVLGHEFAHIRRRDTLIAALARLVKSALWFHPLAWWVARHVSELAEQSCDAVALERMRDPGGYSRILLEFASGVNRAGYRVALPGLAMAASSSGMSKRIDQVFELSRGSARKLARPGVALAFIGLPVLGLAAAMGMGESNGRLLPLQFPLPQLPRAPELIAQVQAPVQERPAVPSQSAPETATVEPNLVFDVASVRAVDPAVRGTNGGSRVIGGPGTSDPGHLRYTQVAIMQWLTRAFSMQVDQFVGPDWVRELYGAERFEISANVPSGATQQQVTTMMQNLLKDRFHLAYHYEKRNLDAYELTVTKGGSKLKAAEIPAELPVPSGRSQANKGEDGFPNLPAGWPTGVGMAEGTDMTMFQSMKALGAFFPVNPSLASSQPGRLLVWRFAFRMITVTQLMAWLQDFQGFAHIVDHSGLTGKFDIKLRFSNGGSAGDGDASEPAPDIFEALEKQLGLKLQKTKAALDVIVIDHIDKTPTEN